MNWFRMFSLGTLLLLLVPVVFLVAEGLGPLRSSAGYSLNVFKSIELTLISSAVASIACAIVFTPLAFFFARNDSKVGETLADIPASIPHPIIGVAILVLFSPLTPFGRFMVSIGIDVFDTFTGLVLALTLISAPIYIKSVEPFFQSMNRSAEHYAQGLGAGKFRTFVSVVLPSSRKGILNASLISMSRAMSEFGSIAIVAYELISPKAFFGTSPASVQIYNLFTENGIQPAATASAVMILFSIAIMIGLRLFASRIGGRAN